MKDSQTQRILAVLADGRDHSCAEIHQRAGFSRLNSRVSELRKQGHDIRCRKVAGVGPESYVYALHGSLDAATGLGEGFSPVAASSEAVERAATSIPTHTNEPGASRREHPCRGGERRALSGQLELTVTA